MNQIQSEIDKTYNTRSEYGHRQMFKKGMKPIAAALLFLGAGLAAYGDTVSVTFNFNSLSTNATMSQIAAYMTTTLVNNGCVGCSVTVSDGSNGTVYADKTYDGDGHVVGPNGFPTPGEVTLGTSDGATSNTSSTHVGNNDTFLSNVQDGTDHSGGDQIDLKFNGLTIDGSVSFDYEIFPDFECMALTSSSCGGSPNRSGIYPDQPSFEFNAGFDAANPVSSFGTNGVKYAVAPGTTNGSNTHSPDSGFFSSESGPQFIGTYSTTSALNGDNTLDFVDWPAAIGIDNLTITYDPPGASVPETSSILLLGTLSLFLLPVLRRVRKA